MPNEVSSTKAGHTEWKSRVVFKQYWAELKDVVESKATLKSNVELATNAEWSQLWVCVGANAAKSNVKTVATEACALVMLLKASMEAVAN